MLSLKTGEWGILGHGDGPVGRLQLSNVGNAGAWEKYSLADTLSSGL